MSAASPAPETALSVSAAPAPPASTLVGGAAAGPSAIKKVKVEGAAAKPAAAATAGAKQQASDNKKLVHKPAGSKKVVPGVVVGATKGTVGAGGKIESKTAGGSGSAAAAGPVAGKKTAAPPGERELLSARRKDGTKPRIMEKLKAMQAPKKINVPMVPLGNNDYALTPENWDWNFIGLKKVNFDKVTKTKHSRAYWILPDGREAEPLAYLTNRHSYFTFGWSNEIPGYEKTTPAIGISSDLQEGEIWEEKLKEGDKWLLDRIIDLNEFLFDTKKSAQIIAEEYYIHRMVKPGKVSEKTGEQLRNQFRQKVPHREIHDPEDIKNKVDLKKRRVIDRKIAIKITDHLKQPITFEKLHHKESTWDGVTKFKGLAYSPATKVSAQFELQIGRFMLAKPREERYELPELPSGSETGTLMETDNDSGATPAAGEEDADAKHVESSTADGAEQPDNAEGDGEPSEQVDGAEQDGDSGELAVDGEQGDGAAAEDGQEGGGDDAGGEGDAEDGADAVDGAEQDDDGGNAAVIESA